MRTRRIACLVGLLAAACSDPRVPARSGPLDVKVCDVITDPARFKGQVVRFKARFTSDCYHGSSLTDFPCLYRGISAYADHRMNADLQRKLYDGVCPPPPAVGSADVTAVFTGVVRERSHHLLLPPVRFELAITGIEGMKVVDDAHSFRPPKR